MIEAALRYQTQGEDWIKRVAIGGVLVFATFFFVPIFTLYGYMLEVIRRVLGGNTDTPPAWGDYDIVQLSINGAKGFVVLFAYGLVVGFISLLPAGVLFLLGAILGSGAISLLGTLLGSVLYLVGIVIMAIIAPVMICNFVLKDELAAGFDFDVLKSLVTNKTMLRAAGMAIVVNLLIGIVTSVLSFTFIGAPIGFVVTFVGLSAVMYIWANGFADAYREVYGELPEIPDGPTKMGVGGTTAGASATAGGAGSSTASEDATTAETPDDVASDSSGSSTTDDTSGPDPSDKDRWE